MARHLDYPPDAIFSPDEAAAALGISKSKLMRSAVARSYLSPAIIRFFWRNIKHLAVTDAEAEAISEARKPREPAPLDLPGFYAGPESVVYVIHNPATDLVKIGVTKNLRDRLNALQNSNGVALKVLHLIHAPRTSALRTEGVLHGRFAADRQIGEWFTFSPDIRAWLQEVKANV